MWRISDYLVIKGGSYFALTSEAIMAGTSIEASLDLGFVWASLSFGADGIIYFDPFWFEVSAYCRISAGINLDLGLFTISFSITLGATIKVWGPDFAGHAEFEIGPCTVPVEFGSPRKVKGEVLPGRPSSPSISRTPPAEPERCRASPARERCPARPGETPPLLRPTGHAACRSGSSPSSRSLS